MIVIYIYIVPFAKVMCSFNSASHFSSGSLNLVVGDHLKLLASNISMRNCFFQFTGSVIVHHALVVFGS